MEHLLTQPASFNPKVNTIYVDMDGVVADFDAFVFKHMGRTFSHTSGPGKDVEMWGFLARFEDLYYQLPPTPYAEELLRAIMAVGAKTEMLTAIPRRATVPTAEVDKIKWMKDNFGHFNIKVNIGPYSRDKWKWAKPGDILIDDRADNIQEWNAAGGIGILHDTNNVAPTLATLKLLTKPL